MRILLPVALPPVPLARSVTLLTLCILCSFTLETLSRVSIGLWWQRGMLVAAAGSEGYELSAAAVPAGTSVSVIVPTFHEADNVRSLAARLMRGTP